ncbi:MAG: ABC transporter permease [Candidatus Saccharimonadales bacterium]
MKSELKAEFKKIFTIRSTYIIFALMLILVGFFSFYVGGWHDQKIDLLDHLRLYTVTQQSISFLAIFPALIGVLLFTHEFRHNLIAYSLTLSNNRSKLLAAKIVVVSILSLGAIAIVGVITPLLADWGAHANHLHLVHQTFYFWEITWKGLVYGWGYALAGLAFAALIRNQIGAIIALFIVPGTVEGLLSIWLKNNTVYLPFSALGRVLGAGHMENTSSGPLISPIHALYVFLGWLVFGWIIAWYLFLKRDAA